MIEMTVQHMLDNAATASQHKPLIDDPMIQGAVLRSIAQWLNSNGENDIEDLLIALVDHPNYGA